MSSADGSADAAPSAGDRDDTGNTPPRPRELQRIAEARLPTAHGTFTVYGYRSASASAPGTEHLALLPAALPGTRPGAPDAGNTDDGPDRALADRTEVVGDGGTVPPPTENVPVRVHSECLTGDVFGSLRCDCGPQLDAALARIATVGQGAVVYLRGQEGRGIGLSAKLAAYALQDDGLDTVDANLALGLPVDARDYGAAALILADLGLNQVRLLTNNPAKVNGLRSHGITVTAREPLPVPPNPENARYLATKQTRLAHQPRPGLAPRLR